MKKLIILNLLFASFFYSCIGDDVIDDKVSEVVSIINPIDTLQIGDTYTFEAIYFDNIGRQQNTTIVWESNDESILIISTSGIAEGIAEGRAIITASVDGIEGKIIASREIIVSQNETSGQTDRRVGSIRTTSTYLLEGDFVLEKVDNNLKLTLLENFRTTDALPGLFVYLGNNQNSISDAYEIGPITQFSGQHFYTIPNTDLFQYQFVLFWCKPFGVKVGEGIFNE